MRVRHHNELREYSIQGLEGCHLHARHEVTVDVEGDLHGRMSEHLGDAVYVGASTRE